MVDKVDTIDKEREKHIKVDMVEMKKRYDTVPEKLWVADTTQTRMDKMSKEQTENNGAIQSNLDVLLRNSMIN